VNAQGDSLTGYLMVKGLFVLHLLEGDSEVLNSFLSALYLKYSGKANCYAQVTVLLFNEENPSRMFDKWYNDTIVQAGPTITLDNEKLEKQVTDRVFEIYQNICQAGANYSKKLTRDQDKQGKKFTTEISVSLDDMCIMFHSCLITLQDYY